LKFLNTNHKIKNHYVLKKNLNYLNYINFFFFRNLTKKSVINVINYTSNLDQNLLDKKFSKTSLKIRNLINYFFKGGDFMKTSLIFYEVFSKLYKLFYSSNNTILIKNYKYFKEFFYNFYIYKNYNNLNYLNNWLITWNELIFTIECTAVPKKYRKKLKKKYIYKVKYLNKNKRLNKINSWLAQYVNSIKNFNLSNRLLLGYLDILLNYKNSYLYNKKLLVYKKIFRI
jgi:hypothetical protein